MYVTKGNSIEYKKREKNVLQAVWACSKKC